MAYNPNPNLYNASINRDTEGLAPGIAAAGQAVAGGIQEFASMRSAAKATDAEYEMFSQMYPDAAGMIDSEKFAAANLQGKQKMLGLAKGYVMEQAEQGQMQQKMAMMEQAASRRSQLQTISTKDGGTLVMTGDGRVAYSNRPDPVEPPLPEPTLKEIGGGYRAVVRGRQMQVIEPKAEEVKAASYRGLQTPDGKTIFRAYDGNGNPLSNVPSYVQEKGEMGMTPGGLPIRKPGALTEIPSAADFRTQGRAPTTQRDKDGNLVQWDPETRKWIPAPIGPDASLFPAAATPAAATPASGSSFLQWNPAP